MDETMEEIEPWFNLVQPYQKQAIEAKNRADQLKGELKSKEGIIANAQNQLNVLTNTVNDKDAQIAECTKELNELKELLKLKSDDITHLNKNIDDLRDQLASKCSSTKSDVQNVEGKVVSPESSDKTEGSVTKSKEVSGTKRYTCPDCKVYSNNTKAKITEHQKHCPATKHLMVKDHQCPICNEVYDYDGLRMHLYHFIMNDGRYIKTSESPHYDKNIDYHKTLKKSLMKAKSDAKKNQIQYMPFYPINRNM